MCYFVVGSTSMKEVQDLMKLLIARSINHTGEVWAGLKGETRLITIGT
jgi:hypothetical protein